MLALIRREEMHNHVTIIEHQPAFIGCTGDATLFLVIIFCGFEHAFGKRVEHTVTGAVANDEVICKRRDVFDVEQQDVFALFVLQGSDNIMCKFECVQISPLGMFATEETSC